MEAGEVLDLLDLFDDQSVEYWLDGGWGVDCLVGEQTRPHRDLDVVVRRSDVDRARELLASRGFEVIRDWLPTSIAFRNDHGREVDIHPVDATTDGGGDQVLLDGSTWHYAPPVRGSIGGREVRCASVQDQLAMHQGYEPRPVDVEDVHRLVDRFDLDVPPPSGGRCPAAH